MSYSEIKIHIPSFPTVSETEKYLKRMEDTQVFSNFGPLNLELEERLADYFGLEHLCVTTLANATLAIEAAISFIRNTKVCYLPAYSFAATGHAVLNSGKRIKFVDVDNNWRGNYHDVPLSSSIVDVAPFGDTIRANLESKTGQFVVIDAAASFDALKAIGKLIDSDRVGVIVSMHATKLMPAGEGGLFFSKNKDWVQYVRDWSNFGFSDYKRESNSRGNNAKLSEIHSAFALASLDLWETKRARYLELLYWAKDLSLQYNWNVQPSMIAEYVSPYWIVRDRPERIQKLVDYCFANNIQNRKWWSSGMHRMKAFSSYATEDLKNTDVLANETIGLPFHLFLNAEEKSRITKAIQIS